MPLRRDPIPGPPGAPGRRELAHAELVAGTVEVPADGAWHPLEGLELVLPASARACMLELVLPEVAVDGALEVVLAPLQVDAGVARAVVRGALALPLVLRRRLPAHDGERRFVTRCRAEGSAARIVLREDGPGSLWATEC